MVVVNDKDREKLFGEYLAGEMREDRAGMLLDRVRADGETREELASLEDVDILLHTLARSADDRELLTDRIMAGLADDARRENLNARVLAEVRETPVVSAPRRVSGRLATRRRRAVPWGMWTAVAACLIVLVGTVLYNVRRSEVGVQAFIAQIAEASGEVYIQRGNERILCVSGRKLLADDLIRTAAGQSVSFNYRNEATRVGVKERSGVKLHDTTTSKRVSLLGGVLDAVVAKQPEGTRFVVETPQAFCRVKGTDFTVAERNERTRLEVRTGTVEIERKKGGNKTDVTAGQYAVAGDGLPLVALPADGTPTQYTASGSIRKPFSDITYRQGRTLFEDDFSKGGGNWVILKKASRSEWVSPSIAKLAGKAETVEVTRDGKKLHVLMIDTKQDKDEWLYARMKKPVTSTRFVVECTGRVEAPYKGNVFADFGALATFFVDGSSEQFFHPKKRSLLTLGKRHTWRREYVVVPRSDGTFEFHMRFWIDDVMDGWGKEVSRDGTFHLDMSVKNGRGLVEHVVIKELVPVEEEQK